MKRLNNTGLTLVELLCTLALLSIVGLAGMAMMATVARMNHTVALQEKQAREAEVVIETVKYQLLKHPSSKTGDTITVQKTGDQEEKTITLKPEMQESGKYDLIMTVKTAANQTGTSSTLASDLKVDEAGNCVGFDLTQPEGTKYYLVTLTYQNGNNFEWVITPRLDYHTQGEPT